MCFPFSAHPPIPAITGAAVEYRDLALQSADGTKFPAFAANSGSPSGLGIVVMPDVRGLFRFYEELALRFAERGINAVAIDYFGRTAGTGKRDADFPWQEHVAQTTQPQVGQDVGAAVAYLRSPEGGSCRHIFTAGFCFGGSSSWNQAANGHGLTGAIGFYGQPATPGRDGSPSVINRVPQFACPVLGLMGGDDAYITAEHIQQFDAALTKAGVEHELITYEGAPHSFFDRTYEEHAEASADAWRRIQEFIAEKSAQVANA